MQYTEFLHYTASIRSENIDFFFFSKLILMLSLLNLWIIKENATKFYSFHSLLYYARGLYWIFANILFLIEKSRKFRRTVYIVNLARLNRSDTCFDRSSWEIWMKVRIDKLPEKIEKILATWVVPQTMIAQLVRIRRMCENNNSL